MSGDHAVLRTTLLHGLVEAARVNVDAGNDARPALRARARVPPVGRAAPERAVARGRHRRAAASRPHEPAVEAIYARVPPAARGAAGDPGRAPPGQGGRDRRRLARRAPPDPARGLVGRLRARRRRVDGAAPRADPLRGRDHVPGEPAGPRDRRRRGRRGRRDSSPPPARPEGPSCGRRRSSTSTTATRWATGRKSVALHLVFQAPDRTLTDEDAAASRARIVTLLSRAPRRRAQSVRKPIRRARVVSG